MNSNVGGDFTNILKNSYCTYAQNAKIEYGNNFSLTQTESLRDIYEALKGFNSRIDADKLDAFVCATYDVSMIPNLDAVSEITCDFLLRLSEIDKGREAAEKMILSADKDGWWYEILGNRYLPSVFSFLHPSSSPRQTCGAQAVFFMFQPVQTFDRASIPAGTEIPNKIRELIRQRYRKYGQPYNEALISSYYEGLKVIEGIPHDKIIKWWKHVV